MQVVRPCSIYQTIGHSTCFSSGYWSDLGIDSKTVYLCYDERWVLELVFRQYKNDHCLDKTCVQWEISLIGSEFINFISTVTTCRRITKARDANLLKKMSFKELMDDLSFTWRMVDSPEPSKSDDDGWEHTINCVFEELEALGLSTPVPSVPPKKRGRLKCESLTILDELLKQPLFYCLNFGNIPILLLCYLLIRHLHRWYPVQ